MGGLRRVARETSVDVGYPAVADAGLVVRLRSAARGRPPMPSSAAPVRMPVGLLARPYSGDCYLAAVEASVVDHVRAITAPQLSAGQVQLSRN